GLIRGVPLNVATSEQRVDTAPTRCRLIGYQVVHARLGHRRIVTFVVTTAAIRDQINDDVAVEALAVFVRQLGCLDYGFWVITVDMEDRSLDGAGHIRGICR